MPRFLLAGILVMFLAMLVAVGLLASTDKDRGVQPDRELRNGLIPAASAIRPQDNNSAIPESQPVPPMPAIFDAVESTAEKTTHRSASDRSPQRRTFVWFSVHKNRANDSEASQLTLVTQQLIKPKYEVMHDRPQPLGDPHFAPLGGRDIPESQLIAPYRQQADRAGNDDPYRFAPKRFAAIPPQFRPWWGNAIAKPLRTSSRPILVDVESLVLGALTFSPQVKAIDITSSIQRTRISEAQGKFDWRAFIDNNWDDTSEPVGNVLTTGRSGRFRDHLLTNEAGLRRTLASGGEFEASQRIGFQDNNSLFLRPQQQGTSRLTLSFTQPLMNGAGKFYNTSRIVLAEVNAWPSPL